MDFLNEVIQKWGDTDAFKEFAQKALKGDMSEFLVPVFKSFGEIKDTDPKSTEAKSAVELLQKTITENFYTCTPEILKGLGEMYTADPRFAEYIDKVGGPGTSAFVSKAISYFCGH